MNIETIKSLVKLFGLENTCPSCRKETDHRAGTAAILIDKEGKIVNYHMNQKVGALCPDCFNVYKLKEEEVEVLRQEALNKLDELSASGATDEEMQKIADDFKEKANQIFK